MEPLEPGLLSPSVLLIASVVMIAGGLVQGSVGFGFALIAAPVLALIDPRLIPGPLIFAGFFLVILQTARERRHIDLTGLKWLVGGRLPGTIAAAAALSVLPERWMGLAFGALVLSAVVMSAGGLRIKPNPWTLVIAGTLSGFMGTISSIGGPPLAIVYQNESGARLRGTLAINFVIGTVLSLIALAAVGRFGGAELRLGLVLVPGIIAGFFLSKWTAPLLDRGYTRPTVLTLSALAALAVILRQVL